MERYKKLEKKINDIKERGSAYYRARVIQKTLQEFTQLENDARKPSSSAESSRTQSQTSRAPSGPSQRGASSSRKPSPVPPTAPSTTQRRPSQTTKPRETLPTQQQKTAKTLILMAKDALNLLNPQEKKELTSLKSTLPQFLNQIKKYDLTQFTVDINGTKVKFNIARSKDGKFFRIHFKAENTEGYESNIVSKTESPWNDEGLMFLDSKGKRTTKLPQNTKFNYDKIRYNIQNPEDPKDKGVIAKKITEILKKGPQAFVRHRELLKSLAQQFNLENLKVDEKRIIHLPNGITIVGYGVKEGSPRPNIMIYKGTKPICYRIGKRFYYANKILSPDHASYGRRMAELMIGDNMLENAFDGIKYSPEKGRFLFTPKALADFKAALNQLYKFTAPSVRKKGWGGIFKGGVEVRLMASGEFRVKFPEGVIYYSPSTPDLIGFFEEIPGQGKGITYYRESKDLLLSRKDYEELRKEKEAKAKPKAERKSRPNERTEAQKARELQQEIRTQRTQREKKEAQDLYKGLLNNKYKSIARYTKDNVIQIDTGNDYRKRNLIMKTKIHELLDLEKVADRVLDITINGDNGKPVRKARYYPGQKTAYLLDRAGKQTNNRVKFYPGDRITLDFKPATKELFDKRNNHRKQETNFQDIENLRLLNKISSLIEKFKEFGGKVQDLDLSKLKKYLQEKNIKEKFFNPNRLLEDFYLRGDVFINLKSKFNELAPIIIQTLETAIARKTLAKKKADESKK
jgi:hypothetical protein